MSGYCGSDTKFAIDNNKCLNSGTNVSTSACTFTGMPLGKPFQGSLKFHYGNWDTLGSHNGLSPFTYGIPEQLFHNPDAIRHVAPYPYRGETEASMKQIFDGLPCCKSWGNESRTSCAKYTAQGIVGLGLVESNKLS